MLAVGGGILAALAVFMIYWPARENGFVWDDWTVLDDRNLTGIRDPARWRETLLRPPSDFSVLFRPLTMLSLLLQLWAGQVEPRPFHLVNLIMHSVSVFLLTLVAWRLLGGDLHRRLARPALAVLCGLIYGVHPALTEPVIWISARSDLIMTVFLLLALLLDRTLPEAGWNRALAVGAVFFAATLAKETSVGFLVALPLVHLAVDRSWTGPLKLGPLGRTLAPHYRVYAALAGASVLYLAVRFAVSGPAFGLDHVVSPARFIESFGQHVLVVVASLAQHAWSALWPFQNIVPGRQLLLPINGMDMLPMAAASAGVLAVAVVAACTNGPGRVPALLFLGFVASLLPVINIVPIPAVGVPNEVAAGSRYVTFPLIFACLAAPFLIRLAEASLVKHVRHGQALLWMIICAWILGAFTNVRMTIPLWKDDAIMNTWAIQQGGASYWRYANIGAYYLRTGDYGRARDALATAVKLRQDEMTAWVWNNLGIAEAGLGHSAQAMRSYQRALELATDEVRSRINIARLERTMGNPRAAADVLEVGLRHIQNSGQPLKEAQLRYELGLAYASLGRSGDAAAQLNAALAFARDTRKHGTFEEILRLIAPSDALLASKPAAPGYNTGSAPVERPVK